VIENPEGLEEIKEVQKPKMREDPEYYGSPVKQLSFKQVSILAKEPMSPASANGSNRSDKIGHQNPVYSARGDTRK
jgi:hypothetical protein